MGNFYNEQTMEAIARNLIKKYDASLLTDIKSIPIEMIIEKLYDLQIDYQYIRKNGQVLGETIFDDTYIPIYDMENRQYTLVEAKGGTIIIDASLLHPRSFGRLRFTLAHELSHWILHKEIYCGTGETAAMTKKAQKSSDSSSKIERQADMLSTSILMPIGQVKIAFYRLKPTTDNIVETLAKKFEVSKQAMEIRLKSCCLI